MQPAADSASTHGVDESIPANVAAWQRDGFRPGWLIAATIYLLVYVVPLGIRPLSAPDELRYSEIPREMLASGDWIVPRLNGLRYFEKPPLGYWAVAVSIRLFGENEFAVRFPAALSVGLSAALVGWLARRTRIDRLAADFAPAVFLTLCGTYPTGTFINLDGMFSALVAGMVVTHYAALSESNRTRRRLLLLAAGGFCGAAFLVKGFVAFVLAIGVFAAFAIWERRIGEVLKTAWIPLLTAVALCVPWGVAIARREPEFWHYFFVVQHVHRFLGTSAEHTEPFWFFIPFLLLGTVPWNSFLASIVIGVRGVGSGNSLIRFLCCWAAFPFLFFSASSGKLITYIMPCYPPIALLMTIGLVAYLRTGRRKLVSAGAVLVASLIGVGVVFLLVQRWVHPFRVELFGPNEGWRLSLAIAGLGVWALLTLQSLRVVDYRRKLMWITAAPVPAFALAAWIFPVELRGEKIPGPIVQKYAARISPGTQLITDRALVHAVCWYYKRNDAYLLDQRAGELEYGASFPDGSHRLLDIDGFRALLTPSPKRPNVVMIIPLDVREMLVRYIRMLKLDDRIPPPKFEATERDLWIGEF